MTSLAHQMRENCARFLSQIPDRDRQRVAQAAADHINTSYPNTLAPLVGDVSVWTGRLAYFDADRCRDMPAFAVAFLGDNTWLHHDQGYDGRSRLHLILPCPCGIGYQMHTIAAPRGMVEKPATEDDLAHLLDRLGQQTDPHAVKTCASVPLRSTFGNAF